MRARITVYSNGAEFISGFVDMEGASKEGFISQFDYARHHPGTPRTMTVDLANGEGVLLLEPGAYSQAALVFQFFDDSQFNPNPKKE